MVGGYTWGLLDRDFVTVAAASVGSNPAPLLTFAFNAAEFSLLDKDPFLKGK
ncbi:hypothetical protein BU26DRAFT_524999, partial [Trematosphaeria pertusa]